MTNKIDFATARSRKLQFLFLILLVHTITHGQAQTQPVQGRVISTKDGSGLDAISIRVNRATSGAVTDSLGYFRLSVPANAVLTFSGVGFASKEVKVSGSTGLLEVQLSPLDNNMDSVVVIGYGSQQKKDLTGSVASISPNQVRSQPLPGIDAKITGQVAGVQVSSVSGTPGGGTSIKIRGSGSVGAGDAPLFVVDGFPISNSFGQAANPLSLLNPDDVESITVLKDASSIAIFGSRGANGVVVITTKQGKKGTPRVDVNGFYGAQRVPDKGRPKMLNGTQYAQFQKEKIMDKFASLGQVATDADIPEAYRNPAQYGKGTDWYDEILRVAPQYNVDASVRGGSDNARYLFSGGYFKQYGTIRYTGFDRYTFRMNTDVNITRNFKAGINLAPTFYNQNRNDIENGSRDILAKTMFLSPIVPVRDASGNRTVYISSPGSFGAPNPLNSLQYAGTKFNTFNGLATGFAEYEIIPNLKARYNISVNYSNGSSFVYNPTWLGGLNVPPPVIASSTTNKNSLLNWLSEGLLTYKKNFGSASVLDVLVGYTSQKERADNMTINANNYPDDLIQTINAAAAIPTYSQDVQQWSIVSYLARANYSLMNKYLLTATIRRDGSSRFGANQRYGTFPSAAIGWRVSEEEFMKGIHWMNELKLRASYGKSGNYNIGNYTYLANIGTTNYSFGGALAGGRSSSSLNNIDLTWEESAQFDAGIDVAALDNKINFTVDVYNRTTMGMLINNEIPRSSGYSNQIINAGKIRNQGLEISLTSRNLNGLFSWKTSGNIAFNRNKVLALNENNATIYSGRDGGGNYTNITKVGLPIGQFFGYIGNGIYKDAQDLASSPRHASSVIGSVKYKDVDGNGIIEPVKDFAVIGKPQPDFIWGLTNDFGYKNFDLSILLVGTQGGHILKASNEYLRNIDGIFNVDVAVLNRWRSPQQPGDGVTPTTNGGTPLYRNVNSSWVESASYMRIQNIALGYNISPRQLGGAKWISSMRVYASVQNLATFTRYSGANPDVSIRQPTGNATTVALVPGIDYSNYPIAQSFNLGLNLSF